METHELTLTNIDSVRHLTASEDVVNAVAYAARTGASDRTAYRFITALVMTASLMDRPRWPGVLRAVKELESPSGQTVDTPLCLHCSDPLDATGRDLLTGLTFCGANPDEDTHEMPPTGVEELEKGHSHAFEWVDDDSMCVADRNCTMTYAEYKKEENRS